MKNNILAFIFLSTLLYSCKKHKLSCELSTSAETQLLTFQLLSKNEQVLIGDFGTLYETKDVQFLNVNGSTPNLSSIKADGSISFLPAKRSDGLNEFIEKDFLLILPATTIVPRQDIDTIKVSYELESSSCNSIQYKSFKVSYNDSLYLSIFPTERLRFIKL